MKTLKNDSINEKLLLETYAYIVSHDALWYQGAWRTVDTQATRCKTPMCFAGHATITLGGGVDVLPLPKPRVWKAYHANTLTEVQKSIVEEWFSHEDHLVATKQEIDAGQAERTVVNGEVVYYVCIEDRAQRLLGNGVTIDRADSLFGGCNTIEDIREEIAEILDISEEKVDEKARKIAEANRWRMPSEIAEKTVAGWQGNSG